MKDSTDITVILDRSGSMASVADDTIGGFNTFLAEQQRTPGEALFSLVQFDHEYQPVYAGKQLAEVVPLTPETFVPRGNTALLDAIGRTLVSTGERLAALAEADRPSKVMVVIITDGHENASRDWTKERVLALISQQQSKYSWEFVFLGANQDAIDTGASIGIAAGSSLSYAADGQGARDAFESTSSKLRGYRSSASAPAPAFTPTDRAKQQRSRS
jgi:hypothetical protein